MKRRKPVVGAPRITPFLWFDGQAREAADFYISIFKDSRIIESTPMVVTFELAGQRFMGLNGGPQYQFTEAISFLVRCETQREIDYYWDRLSAGGRTQQCGWLKDKFGVSWQIVPSILGELLNAPDQAGARRAMEAMLGMVKLDIKQLKSAFASK
jgi:predicted 3-demethylubiquinone-9 3-methyltransferase (glyoxalase superfamily)